MMIPDPALEKTAQQFRLNGYIVTPPGFDSSTDYRIYMRAIKVLDWLGEDECSVRTWSVLKSCCSQMNVGQLADEVLSGRFRQERMMGRRTLTEVKDALLRYGVISRDEGFSDSDVAA